MCDTQNTIQNQTDPFGRFQFFETWFNTRSSDLPCQQQLLNVLCTCVCAVCVHRHVELVVSIQRPEISHITFNWSTHYVTHYGAQRRNCVCVLGLVDEQLLFFSENCFDWRGHFSVQVLLLLWGGGGDYGDDASGPENKDKYVRFAGQPGRFERPPQAGRGHSLRWPTPEVRGGGGGGGQRKAFPVCIEVETDRRFS